VSYTLLDSQGPAHERTFTAAAVIGGVHAGVGKGGSKKDAEQEAAREALEGLAAMDGGTPPV
jgi:ribonuclease-3